MSYFENQVIIPEGKQGIATIKHFHVSKHDSMMTLLHGGRSYVREGDYQQLLISGHCMMSNTRYEQISNYEIVGEARGRILIFGLGIGMILPDILAKKEIVSVAVVEKLPDVIALVAPHFENNKLQIIEGDAFTWKPEKGVKYDTIYFDIWADYNTDLLADMGKLLRRCVSWKAPGAWVGCWMRDSLLSEKRREKNSSCGW